MKKIFFFFIFCAPCRLKARQVSAILFFFRFAHQLIPCYCFGQSAENAPFPIPFTDELAFQINITSAGEILIAGRVATFVSEECYISKHDKEGNFLWSKIIGGMNYDYFQKTIERNNFIIAGGNTNSSGNSQNFFVVNFDETGDTVWTKITGGKNYDKLMDIIPDETGLLLGGYSNSFGTINSNDLLLIKTDSSANPLWAKSFEANGEEILHAVKKTGDGFLIAGSTSSFGAGMKDIFTLKTDSMGNIEWMKCFGGAEDEDAIDVVAEDENFYVTGYTKSLSGFQDLWILKLDSTGNLLWNKVIDFGLNEKGNKIFFKNGKIFVCGYLQSFTGTYDDLFVLSVDQEGNNISARNFPLPGQQYGNFIGEADEKIFVAGFQTDSMRMKIFETNDTLFSCSSVPINFDSSSMPVSVTDTFFNAKSISVDSLVQSRGGDYTDYGNALVNADACFLTTETNSRATQATNNSQFTVFPNPNNGKFILKAPGSKYEELNIMILNITGEIIFQSPEVIKDALYSFNLPSGIYFLRISDGNTTHSEKIVILDF